LFNHTFSASQTRLFCWIILLNLYGRMIKDCVTLVYIRMIRSTITYLFILVRTATAYNETGFFFKYTGFFSKLFGEKSGKISFGKLRRARRAAREASPGRIGQHWNILGSAATSAVAHMVGASQRATGMAALKTNG
jgi:hypothetical protein